MSIVIDHEPVFAHDCDACTYLGDALDPETSSVADLYFCTQGGSIDTVIARLSAEESDYISGLGVPHPLLDIARTRAAAAGLHDQAAVTATTPSSPTRTAIVDALSTATDRVEVERLVQEAITLGRKQASDGFGWDALTAIFGGPHANPKALLASRDAMVRAETVAALAPTLG